MPIAPDRVKNKIASLAFARLMGTSQGEEMASRNAENVARMSGYEAEESAESGGKLAMMAMWSALQSGDFESAFEALSAAVSHCKM